MVSGPLLTPPSGVDPTDSGAALWWRHADGIVCNRSYAARVTPEHLRKGFAISRELGHGRKVVLVSEAGPLAGTSREARDLLAGPEACATYLAMAVLVRSPVARTIMNFFMRFSSPPFEVRIFTHPPDAIAWAEERVARE